MTTQPPRTYPRLAIAIVVAALIIGSVVYVTISSGTKTTTVTTTVTTTQPTTLTTTVTSTSAIGSEGRVYRLTFQQTGGCGPPPGFLAPWSVTLGNNETGVEPPNASLPISNVNFRLFPQLANYSSIVFSVPDGTYSYVIAPASFLYPRAGNVTVSGADVTITINGPEASCTTIASTSTESAGLERSGPISTFPIAWMSSCSGENTEGNTSTAYVGMEGYPGTGNATIIPTLEHAYDSIVNSAAFMNVTSSRGWIVASWEYLPGAGTNIPPGSNDIVGLFILINGTSPNGYVMAFYDTQNGGVAVSYQQNLTIACSTTVSG